MITPVSAQDLPVNSILPELRSLLASSTTAVLSAPPGSGKTTLVPLALLDQEWLKGKKILLLEPRRLAARASAARMATLLGEEVGERVGYQVRFDRCVSGKTRIEVVTEGILTRRMQHDPDLTDVGMIIFDEFHERSLHGDLALALALDLVTSLREDLRLLVMSATLDTQAVSSALFDAPVVTADGRSYPVAINYLTTEPNRRTHEYVAAAVLQALNSELGDILVFLPGTGEIRSTLDLLTQHTGCAGTVLCPLYGDLSRQEQDQAILPDPQGRRRVVLATSIAETSLTIEGISTVIDSGWSRLPRFDPNSGLSRLVTQRVSRAAAEQRAGRAGRMGPGVCYRLWSESTQSSLQPFAPPEIEESDLASLVLELAQWGVAEPADLRWLTPPPMGAVAQAKELLQGLDAIDSGGRITPAGKDMAGMGAHPRLAHMLLVSQDRGQEQLAADLAALLTERDLINRAHRESVGVDLRHRLEILDIFRQQGASAARDVGADVSACRRVELASRQLWRRLDRPKKATLPPISVAALLATAYPDRIAQCRGGDGSGYLLSSGRGVRLPEADQLAGSEYLVVAQMDAGRRDGRVFLAERVTKSEIRESLSAHIRRCSSIEWDRHAEAVTAHSQERLGSLTLNRKRLQDPDAELVMAAMLDGIRDMGLDALPWSEQSREWQARVCSLRLWQRDAAWPDLSDATLLQTLDGWLAPWLDGITTRDHLRRVNLVAILRNLLEWQQQQLVDRLAPSHIQVPSGSRVKLQYRPGEEPILAVRLQEMFGLMDTPTICDGRVKLVLHLLSPARRPIQVTGDLRGFWDRTYAEVKKELKGRYPKHYWPDDPMRAQPTSRVRPKTK
ncbi:MAG: ATP-dependent helicase HrpB [Gammaproteobacteria bacterium]